jgi:hypothetical protein
MLEIEWIWDVRVLSIDALNEIKTAICDYVAMIGRFFDGEKRSFPQWKTMKIKYWINALNLYNQGQRFWSDVFHVLTLCF